MKKILIGAVAFTFLALTIVMGTNPTPSNQDAKKANTEVAKESKCCSGAATNCSQGKAEAKESCSKSCDKSTCTGKCDPAKCSSSCKDSKTKAESKNSKKCCNKN